MNKTPQAKQELARRIQYLPTQLEHYQLLDEQMLSNFAGIYVDVISPLGRRIQVTGATQYLQQLSTQKPHSCGLTGRHSFRRFVATRWAAPNGSVVFRSKIAAMAQQILSSL